MFHGALSTYLWEDSSGVTHTIPQGEGGEQGDPLMPLSLLFGATQRVGGCARRFVRWRVLFRVVGYVATTPDRVGDVYQSVDEHLWDHSRIRIHWRQEGGVECN